MSDDLTPRRGPGRPRKYPRPEEEEPSTHGVFTGGAAAFSEGPGAQTFEEPEPGPEPPPEPGGDGRPSAHAHPMMQFARAAPAGTMRVESRGRVNINANRRGPESRVGGLG